MTKVFSDGFGIVVYGIPLNTVKAKNGSSWMTFTKKPTNFRSEARHHMKGKETPFTGSQ